VSKLVETQGGDEGVKTTKHHEVFRCAAADFRKLFKEGETDWPEFAPVEVHNVIFFDPRRDRGGLLHEDEQEAPEQTGNAGAGDGYEKMVYMDAAIIALPPPEDEHAEKKRKVEAAEKKAKKKSVKRAAAAPVAAAAK
jgi:hypothetical protein